jgi:flavin-dependent dehydrogenase
LLVGDAGAMVDPFTGHGIHHALKAGRLAGTILADHLTGTKSGPDPATRYANEVAELLGREIIPGARLQRLHARPRLVRLAIPLARIHPGLRSLMMALVGHAADRHDLLSPRNLIASCLQVARERDPA